MKQILELAGKKVRYSDKDLTYERWRRGRLAYKLHAGQRKLREVSKFTKRQLFVGECSRQFGKSFESVVDALEMGIQKPNSRIKYGTAFQKDLLEFIIPNFNTALSDCPDNLRYKFRSQGSKFIHPNGSEIHLVGLDLHPNSLRGNALDLIIIDEAGFVNRLNYLYKSVILPATTHRPNCRIKMISTPPSTPAHDFVEFVQKSKLEQGHVKFTIFDNPMLTQEDRDRIAYELGGYDSTEFRREYLCEHILDEDLAIIGNWKEEYCHEIVRNDYFKFYDLYVGMDMGVSDWTAVIFGYYDYLNATLVIEDELMMRGSTMTTEKLYFAIKEKENELKKNNAGIIRRIADNNNPLLLQDLSNPRFANNRELEPLTFAPVEKGYLEEMVNQVKVLVQAGRIRVNPRCKYLSGCLQYGVWNERRTDFARSKHYGHFDSLAALIYLVRNISFSKNPIPDSFGVDFQNQVFFQRKATSGDMKSVLANAFKRRG